MVDFRRGNDGSKGAGWFRRCHFFRGSCWLCRMPLTLPRHGLCSYCMNTLPCLSDACPRCALPMGKTNQTCGRCLRQPPPWFTLICAGLYEPPLSLLIGRLKFFRTTALSTTLARLMLLSWLKAKRQRGVLKPDLLLAVPLHRWRAWQRGFNQTDLLVRALASWLCCDYHPDALGRQRTGDVQHSLSANARQRNLRGAFSLDASVEGRHIALIDDVVTTGSTVTEISRLLLHAGAASVQVWCLCRTLSHTDDARMIIHQTPPSE
jgi:ComF family protein